MSMLDSFFNKGFKGPKCKTLLKLTIPRIKLLRNRREIQLKQMRRDIAKLLETGQEATARIRVEHIIREENMMAAQEIIELFCELIAVRIPIIEVQRECPLDLKEAISSVCFAAPRCADLPELMHVQMLFASKFGKEFVAAATELRPDCGVNRQIIELLSVRAPAPEKKLKLLKEIAEAHGLDWDPSSSESEIFKQPEDLLNGPSQFTSLSTLPLPKEKHEETLKKVSSQSDKEQYDSDSGFDDLAFPEVPKVLVMRPIERDPSMPQVRDAGSGSEDEVCKTTEHHHTDLKQEEVTQKESGSKTYEETNYEAGTANNDLQQQSFLPSSLRDASPFSQPSTTTPFITKDGSDVSVDLQDVLAAAQAAADSAERAASAARSAASLAQVRISELVRKKNEEVSDSQVTNASPVQGTTNEGTTIGKASFGHGQSFGNSFADDQSPTQTGSGSFSPSIDEYHWGYQTPHPDSSILNEIGEIRYYSSSSSFAAEVFQPAKHHPQQPERCTSLDDNDADFSYPNLFSSKRETAGSGDHSVDK